MLLTSIITQIYVNLLQFSIEQYSLKTIGLYGCNPSVYQFSSLSVPWRIVRVDSPATSTMRFCQMLASYPCPASLLSMTNQDCIYWTIISFLIWSLVASDRCPPWFEETVSQSLLRHTNHEFAIQELWLLNVDTLCLELRTLSLIAKTRCLSSYVPADIPYDIWGGGGRPLLLVKRPHCSPRW